MMPGRDGVFLGVDAGNTKTLAAVCSADGTLLGHARGGTGDIYGVPAEREAVDTVLATVDAALGQAGLARGDVSASAWRLAGIDWDADERLWRDVLDSECPGMAASLKNDGYALIRCGDLTGHGVAINAGTGAAVAGVGPAGEFALSWWFQHDLGGGALVRAALRAVYLAELGMAPATPLRDLLCDFYGAADPAELLERHTRRHAERWSPSSAAPLVLSAASDPVASGLVAEQAARLGDYATMVADRVGLPPDACFVLGGGVVEQPGSPLGPGLIAHLREVRPQARVVVGGTPLLGTLLDALAEGGAQPDPGVRARLAAALEAPVNGETDRTLRG